MFRVETGASLAADTCAPGACVHSRRGFLRGVGALAATPLAAPAIAQVSPPASPVTTMSPRRIDVHHHCYPPKWIAAKRAQIFGTSEQAEGIKSGWSPQVAIEQMEKNGVVTGINCVSNPGVWFGDKDEARGLQRDCNEYMAQLARDYPKRFGVFASLAIPDVDGALREVEYAYDTLKVDGVHLFTSYGDKWPGDPVFDPVFAELNRRNAIVFIHPTAPNCCGKIDDGSPTAILEFPFDEARCIASLVLNGVVSKYKNIRFIFTHAGGPMPALSVRLSQLQRNPKIAGRVPEGVMAALKTLHFDVANSTRNPSAMASVLAMTSTDKLMCGTDYPYVAMESTVGGLGNHGLSAEALAAIDRGNALKLLPRFA